MICRALFDNVTVSRKGMSTHRDLRAAGPKVFGAQKYNSGLPLLLVALVMC